MKALIMDPITFLNIAATVFLAVAFVTFIRNQRVYRFRIALLEFIRPGHPGYQSDLFDHMLEEITAVSYHRMVVMFWRPLESFYADTDVLALYKAHQGVTNAKTTR